MVYKRICRITTYCNLSPFQCCKFQTSVDNPQFIIPVKRMCMILAQNYLNAKNASYMLRKRIC